MKKIIFYNFVIFITLYILAEVLSGSLIFKKKLNCSYLMCNKTYNFVTPFDFYKDKKEVIYSRDKYGFRGRFKDFDKIDILTVGGSTTDERFLKLSDTWSEKLESKLNLNLNNIDVVNAGIDGQSTYGHIWNFEEWFAKLDNFKPKYSLFYIGINERLNLMHYDNHYGVEINMNLLRKIKYYIKKNNGITYKLIHHIYKKFILNDKYIVNSGVSHGKRVANYSLVNEEYSLSKEYEIYLYRNLKVIYEYSKKIGSEPIFITQKTLLGKYENQKYLSIDKINNYLHEKYIAEIIINFCSLYKVKCLNLNNNLDFLEEDMYDLVHTTPSGSEKIAQYIYLELKDYLILN